MYFCKYLLSNNIKNNIVFESRIFVTNPSACSFIFSLTNAIYVRQFYARRGKNTTKKPIKFISFQFYKQNNCLFVNDTIQYTLERM